MKDQRGAQHLAEGKIWLAWQHDRVYLLAAELAIAWDAKLSASAQQKKKAA